MKEKLWLMQYLFSVCPFDVILTYRYCCHKVCYQFFLKHPNISNILAYMISLEKRDKILLNFALLGASCSKTFKYDLVFGKDLLLGSLLNPSFHFNQNSTRTAYSKAFTNTALPLIDWIVYKKKSCDILLKIQRLSATLLSRFTLLASFGGKVLHFERPKKVTGMICIPNCYFCIQYVKFFNCIIEFNSVPF